MKEFQSPEGDSLFFYSDGRPTCLTRPRRFRPPKGIRCFSTNEDSRQEVPRENVSVPRRGFVVFLRAAHLQRPIQAQA